MSGKMEREDQPENHNPQTEDLKLQDIEDDYDVVQPRQYPEKPENLYVSSPVKKPLNKPPLPVSPASMDTTCTYTVTHKANRLQYLNTALILFVLVIALVALTVSCALSIWLTARADYDDKLKQLNASIHERMEEHARQLNLTVEAHFTRVREMLEENNGEEFISRFNFAKLSEDIEENFTAAFHHIQRINSSLQDHISTASITSALLQQDTEELARNITWLNVATESIDTRLTDFANVARRNATIFTDSPALPALFHSDLRQLELDTEELARNVTELDDATERVDTQLSNFADETRKNATVFTSSLGNISRDLRQLELDSKELARNFTDAMERVDTRLIMFATETRRNATTFTKFLGNISSGLRELELGTEELAKNFTDSIERTDTQLMNFAAETRINATNFTNSLGNISSDLKHLELDTEELARNITLSEHASERIGSQLINLANEARTNATTFTNSLANFSTDLRELERATSMSLNLVNLSLHQDIRVLSVRLTTVRAEAHGLVNRSSAEIFMHIENQITEVRGHISTQVSEVRGHADNQVSEVRGHIDSQVSEVREYIDSQDSDVTASVNEHVDSEIRGVTGIIDAKVSRERQYVDTEINRIDAKLSGAIPLQSKELLIISLLPLVLWILH